MQTKTQVWGIVLFVSVFVLNGCDGASKMPVSEYDRLLKAEIEIGCVSGKLAVQGKSDKIPAESDSIAQKYGFANQTEAKKIYEKYRTDEAFMNQLGKGFENCVWFLFILFLQKCFPLFEQSAGGIEGDFFERFFVR